MTFCQKLGQEYLLVSSSAPLSPDSSQCWGWVAQIFCRRLVFATVGLATLMTGPGPHTSISSLIGPEIINPDSWLARAGPQIPPCLTMQTRRQWDIIKCMIAALGPPGQPRNWQLLAKRRKICISSSGYDQIRPGRDNCLLAIKPHEWMIY